MIKMPRLYYWLKHEFRPIRRIKKFIQRGRRGWSDEDTWSFDHYLCDVISQGVRHLAKTAHGYPSQLSKGDSDTGFEEWQRILIAIAEGFEAQGRLLNDEFYDWSELYALTPKTGFLNSLNDPENPYHKKHKEIIESKEYKEARATHLAKANRGFNLFNYYFGNLWD